MAYTQEQRFDHQRDLRKNGDLNDFPDRMNQPLTTAMDVVARVKAMDNYTAGEKLIEQYAQTFAVAVPLDRRFALAKMVGYCEGIVKSGILGKEELRLRSIIADVLAAFNLPSKAERADG